MTRWRLRPAHRPRPGRSSRGRRTPPGPGWPMRPRPRGRCARARRRAGPLPRVHRRRRQGARTRGGRCTRASRARLDRCFPREDHPQPLRGGLGALDPIRRGTRQLDDHAGKLDRVTIDPHAVHRVHPDRHGRRGVGGQAGEIDDQPGSKVIDPPDAARRERSVPANRYRDGIRADRRLDGHDGRRRRHRRGPPDRLVRTGTRHEHPSDRPAARHPHRAPSGPRSRLRTSLASAGAASPASRRISTASRVISRTAPSYRRSARRAG